ncbi:MAG TPA: hypothetical protein VFJ24_06635 [Gaiellales bacterium]|nr:hypothetical protein [Gaiellales bacterium]
MKKRTTTAKRATKDLQLRKGADVKGGAILRHGGDENPVES